MAITKLPIESFIQGCANCLLLDVRSPAEYHHAHIPGARSLALFSDEERKIVGTTYKQQSREQAIRAGLEMFGPKMRRMIEETEQMLQEAYSYVPDKEPPSTQSVYLYCWRGGMRSAGVGWLLDLYGFRVYTLQGGYKSFRRWVLGQFQAPWPLRILGGYTGSAKTRIIAALKARKIPAIDLESLAGHRGSAFGAIGMEVQASQEMFENKLALALPAEMTRVNQEGLASGIWIEDESQRIGKINLPQPLWNLMRSQPVYFLDIPFEQRLAYIISEYGRLNKGDLAAAITRIQKRLGGLETKTALNCLVEGDLEACFGILLRYYDKRYLKSLYDRPEARDRIVSLSAADTDPAQNLKLLESVGAGAELK